MTIAVERAALVDIPKDKIQFWLETFRIGDVTDKKYQAKVIDSFVQAVYLYDGEMRIAFNYFGKQNGVTVSLSEIEGLGGSASAESSYSLSPPPPKKMTACGGLFFWVPRRLRPHWR